MNKILKVIILTTAIFMILFSCKTFKGDIPIGTEIPDSIYISPINQDGIKDNVILPVDIPEIKGLKLTGYLIEVSTDVDNVVYSDGSEITKKKKTVKVPRIIVWDGSDNEGEWVTDGVYFLKIEAWDKKNNRGTSDPIKIIVDNTKPDAELSLPYSVFSPNNDGNQDTLYINQSSVSPETEWAGTFKNTDGNSLKNFKWTGLARDFEWNGTDDKGAVLPDGDYNYSLSATDLAGNSNTIDLTGIKIDNRVFPVSATLKEKSFSPNGDGIKDTLTINLSAESKNNIIDSSAVITDSRGNPVREYLFKDKLPESFNFDGKNSDGMLLPEGSYYCKLDISYKNGDKPSVVSSPFKIDITKPYAVISKSYDIFSPDGDGNRDMIDIYQSTSFEKEWVGIIYNSSGNPVKKYVWKNRATVGSWYGKGADDKIVPDGTYSYTLSSTDQAGNSASYELSGIRIDTRPTPVKITSSIKSFSPNNDGIADDVNFLLSQDITEGIIGWEFAVLNEKGAPVYTYVSEEKTIVPASLPWNGMDMGGKVNEGKYKGKLTVNYEKGNIASSMTENTIVIDISAPVVTPKLIPLPFSPDDDGENDVLSISVILNDPSGVKGWSSSILDPAGSGFINIPSSLYKNNTYNWNGKSSTGELVQSASDYKLIIFAEDSLGNKGKTAFTIPIDILVIKDGDKLRISISSIYFKPNTADYLSVEPETAARNIATLDRLAVILNKYNSYKINLEGHAVRVYWKYDDKWLTEEKEVLLPLSKKRADVIKEALSERKIDPKRMQTKGFGGYVPIIPHSDYQNRWKNRRVDFILVK